MKKIFLAIIGVLGFSALSAQTLEKVWEANEGLPVPESVLYDGAKKVLYVSLIDGGGTEKDGKGGIALLNLDGTVKNGSWVTGLNAPKGLALYEGLCILQILIQLL